MYSLCSLPFEVILNSDDYDEDNAFCVPDTREFTCNSINMHIFLHTSQYRQVTITDAKID